MTALYYLKFLSYADGHVFHSFSVAVPLLFYAVYRAVTFGEATLANADGSAFVGFRSTHADGPCSFLRCSRAPRGSSP